MTPTCFVYSKKNAIPITLLTVADFDRWLAKQTSLIKNWLNATQFNPTVGSVRLIPNASGHLAQAICCISEKQNLWDVGALPFLLPEGNYYFDMDGLEYQHFAIAWGLGAYQFVRYKAQDRLPANLVLPNKIDHGLVLNMVESIYLVRDLINTPTEDMGPTELAAAVVEVGKAHQAKVTQYIGDDLLKHHYPAIHLVGRASNDPPRLVDLRWGKKKHFKLTLIGKGVCFDSGGLDLKPSSAMFLMKKDMAGAAHVLGLARMIMQAELPIHLRVLIPMVENVISGNAYRPGDIVKGRKGTTIEIGNTDAEGRVILSDVLTEAVSERPDLLIDMTTLTGAARVAVGGEIAAFFSNQDELAQAIMHHSRQTVDPMWQLPLYQPYREELRSPIADLTNSPEGLAGAITAALFLKEFVPDDVPWLHFDMMAWNLKPRPGRPIGGEAMALRGLFNYLMARGNGSPSL